ncbi:MAG: sigma 54-interacting transcriptional regulator [Eubacterium sp.]|nr:sigma 54-interacting transcriptional regulator [Eubacterium sp.]
MPTRNAPVFDLPCTDALTLFTSILDRMDAKVLIIRKDGRFLYYNEQYINYYGKQFAEFGMAGDDTYINIYDIDFKDTAILAKYLKSEEKLEKWLNSPGSEKERNVFTDIHPLYLQNEYFGIVVIEYNTEEFERMHAELSYYKILSRDLRRQLNEREALPPAFDAVVGESSQMLKMLKMCAHVAPTMSSICLLGESGTGKEVIADAIHASSSQTEGPIVKVNCAAIPETLIESEMFGYEKGAFTGANPHGSAGKFELANGGTLFLDEIGELPLAMQAKLLRALQDKSITRIGGSKPIQLNFRLITATNRNLEEMVKEGTFREDLYYRICVIPIHLPPLRERKDDILLLANEFLATLNDRKVQKQHFSVDVQNALVAYDWPGNIRELRNCVERMSILSMGEEIGTDVLPTQLAGGMQPETDTDSRGQYNLHKILEKAEDDTIRTVLSLTEGNRSKAIEMLGISKRNFYIKLEKYGLK